MSSTQSVSSIPRKCDFSSIVSKTAKLYDLGDEESVVELKGGKRVILFIAKNNFRLIIIKSYYFKSGHFFKKNQEPPYQIFKGAVAKPHRHTWMAHLMVFYMDPSESSPRVIHCDKKEK